MFWKKKKKETEKDATWEKLIRHLETMNVEIIQLKKEVEVINGKLRSKLYKGRDKESDGDTEESDESTRRSEKKYNDGFDELRELRRKPF